LHQLQRILSTRGLDGDESHFDERGTQGAADGGFVVDQKNTHAGIG
jgi:hypothetical protein